MLLQALENAKSSGRHDVADYLTLKATNDAIRQASVSWLFDSLVEMASHANRSGSSISIERKDPHSFAYRGSNMVGSRLSLRQGVRCLTIEAGWTRTPADGFMRGGALAFARISHFGLPRASAGLLLQRSNDSPIWMTQNDGKPGFAFKSESWSEHFRIFTGD